MSALEVPSTTRRLPIYGLIDASGSMHGPPLEAAKNGLNELLQAQRADTYANETAWMSVITFSSDAQVALPLTSVTTAQMPELTAGGGTSLTKALERLSEQLKVDWQPRSEDHPGDFKAILWLLTDGHFNHGWKPAVENFLKEHRARFSRIIAIGCGSVNVDALKTITEEVYASHELSPAHIKQACAFLSQSIKAAAKKVSVPTAAAAPQPPPPPAGFQLAA